MRFLLILLCACAHDLQATYPAAAGAPTGTLVLQMSQPASDVSVAINGVLVVDDVHTQKVTIAGIPVGTQEVVMAANGADKQFSVWVTGDHVTTVPLGVPDAGAGFVKTLFGTIVTIVVYSLLHH